MGKRHGQAELAQSLQWNDAAQEGKRSVAAPVLRVRPPATRRRPDACTASIAPQLQGSKQPGAVSKWSTLISAGARRPPFPATHL